MKKKIWIPVLAACVVVIGASFGVTFAYLTASEKVVNEFTVGENSIEIEENFKPPAKVVPGTTITKEVAVSNTGSLSCYVRVWAEFSDSKAKDYCLVDFDTTSWVYNKNDGYYYYIQALEPGEKTDNLFNKITIKTYKKEGDPTSETYGINDMIDFDVLVYAESCEKGTFTDYEAAWKHAAGEEDGA